MVQIGGFTTVSGIYYNLLSWKWYNLLDSGICTGMKNKDVLLS